MLLCAIRKNIYSKENITFCWILNNDIIMQILWFAIGKHIYSKIISYSKEIIAICCNDVNIKIEIMQLEVNYLYYGNYYKLQVPRQRY